LIAAWPGIANVALGAVSYLREKLKAEEFAEVEPLPFFDLGGISIEDNIIQSPEFPRSIFYYWKSQEPGKDLIIFEGEAQPSVQTYQFATKVLEFAQGFKVKQVYTLAAALVQRFKEEPEVWVAATEASLLEKLDKQGLVLKGDFYVAGMNGLLLSVAKEKKVDGICLLGETPHLPAEVGNPFASLTTLKALSRIIKLDLDLTELADSAKHARREIDKLTLEMQREFLSQFTVPLWDRSEEESD
jgi:hypothetical protein